MAMDKNEMKQQVTELKKSFPAVKELPDTVMKQWGEGRPLVDAYRDFEKTETERLRKENEVLRQNEASAMRAPVREISGVAVKESEKTDFLKGFDEKEW